MSRCIGGLGQRRAHGERPPRPHDRENAQPTIGRRARLIPTDVGSEMKIVFKEGHPVKSKPDPRRDRSAGVPPLSDRVLDRHRARVLRPGDAPLAVDAPPPAGTVYRYQRLLVCDKLLANRRRLSEVDDALIGSGYRLGRERIPDKRADRMYRAELRLGERSGPGTVDAWNSLQLVRSAVKTGRCGGEALNGLHLEHVLVAARGGGPSAGTPSPELESYSTVYPARMPVQFAAPMPPRRPTKALTAKRRPVIAVLDTGVAPTHPAFDVADRGDATDAFVQVDRGMQQAITAESDPDAPPLDEPWDSEVSDGSLIGDVSSHFGHGTFIAGLVRQLAPDAQVRSVRVMHNDGLVYEHECMHALSLIADEVQRARDGDDTADPVDMVCLSFGFVDENPNDQPSGGLMRVVKRLSRLGVPVIAAAGNQATDRPFYPAALAAEQLGEDAAPIVSVGALNPNGSVAMFSNDGDWLSCFATGAAMVSTFPAYGNGSRRAGQGGFLGSRYRESYDVDDFSSGWAVWNGTSFAAPVVASAVANSLLCVPGVDLTDYSPSARSARVDAAIRAVREGATLSRSAQGGGEGACLVGAV